MMVFPYVPVIFYKFKQNKRHTSLYVYKMRRASYQTLMAFFIGIVSERVLDRGRALYGMGRSNATPW